MVMKKGLLTSVLITFSAFLTGCLAGTDPTGTSGGVLGGVWNKILWMGSLGFLGLTGESPMVGFMRILVLVLVFAVLWWLAGMIGLAGGVRTTIAAVLAIMTAVFMPGAVLAGIGVSYATLVSFLLIGIPVALALFLLFRIPGGTWVGHLGRIVAIILLIILLYHIREQAIALLNVGPRSFLFI